MSTWACANMIFDKAWEPIGGSGTGVICGIAGCFSPPIGYGVGIGAGAQWALAYSACAERECEEY
jgi:hypothetical protein